MYRKMTDLTNLIDGVTNAEQALAELKAEIGRIESHADRRTITVAERDVTAARQKLLAFISQRPGAIADILSELLRPQTQADPTTE